MRTTQAMQTSTPSETQFSATRFFDAPIDLMWDLNTDPTHLPNWLLGPEGWTMPVCEVDLRPGGKWHWEWASDDGRTLVMDGEYLEVDPPHMIINTERWGGEWPETTNTLELTEERGGTCLTVTTSYPSREARDAALATGMADGMAISYDRLERYIETLR